jgi:hypothetical protein
MNDVIGGAPKDHLSHVQRAEPAKKPDLISPAPRPEHPLLFDAEVHVVEHVR